MSTERDTSSSEPTTTRSGPGRPSLAALYGRLPVPVPPVVKNAYHRLTLEDEFDGYDHPPDPFAVRRVDPARVEGFTGRAYPPYHEKAAQLGTVREGDWDQRADAPIVDADYRERYELYRGDGFTNSTFFQSLQAHFDDGVDWENTPFVERCLTLAERGEPSWRSLTSREAILERCEKIDELYDRIRSSGYHSQRALGEPSIRRVTDEVVVDIGRDGQLLFVNGRHRLAIAKLLGLESIPVGVLVRHAKWMDTRDAYALEGRSANDGCDSSLQDHPDLRDLEGDEVGPLSDTDSNGRIPFRRG